MSYGRVCKVHNQWCPEGVCPYCPAPDLLDEVHGPEVHGPEAQWPAALAHVPPAARFIDATTGRPKPVLGLHYPSLNHDACALCGKSGMEIAQDPATPCDPPPIGPWAGLGTASAALQAEQAERVAQAKADAVAKGRALARCEVTACGYRCDNPDGHEGMHRFGAPRP